MHLGLVSSVFSACAEKTDTDNSNSPFGFTFEFIRSNDSINGSINESINRELTKDESTILEILNKKQRYSKGELAAQIGKSATTVQRIIKSLTDKGLIRRVGSNKNGYWTAK